VTHTLRAEFHVVKEFRLTHAGEAIALPSRRSVHSAADGDLIMRSVAMAARSYSGEGLVAIDWLRRCRRWWRKWWWGLCL